MSFESNDALKTWKSLSPQERTQLHRLSAEMSFHSRLIKDEAASRKLLAPALATGSISERDYAYTATRLGSLTNFYYFNYHHVGPAITAIVLCETGLLGWRKRPSAFIRGFFLFPIAFATATLATQSAIARRIDLIWEGLDNPTNVGKAIHSRLRDKDTNIYPDSSRSEELAPEFAPDTVDFSPEVEPSEVPSPSTAPSAASTPSQVNPTISKSSSRWEEIRAASNGKGTPSTWDEIRQHHERPHVPVTHGSEGRGPSENDKE
ncbi:hypothetical protein EV361DRAFT_942816 [Lentinula raphanica]|nr:hypothetical protein EV361DRAFT_942816 [Lentinula raphanica]